MKKQLYKLTAIRDCETDWETFEKGDEVYTYSPKDYGKENFEWMEWDEKRPFE